MRLEFDRQMRSYGNDIYVLYNFGFTSNEILFAKEDTSKKGRKKCRRQITKALHILNAEIVIIK